MRLCRLAVVVAVFLGGSESAWAQFNLWGSTPPAMTPPEAVVRIAAPETDGISYGSGTLVAVNDMFGLVVTNWHVIRDAAGTTMVHFPNGFTSAATILKIDRDWDLAALMIWRPNVRPIPISNRAPQLGEVLTIAGYGSGSFRAIAGRCTQYVSPGGNLPFEMVELDAAARNGDSGGPIFNSHGELAGVLFGSSFGKTTGSYCGRLRWFVNSVDGDFQRASQAMLARQNRRPTEPAAPGNAAYASAATQTVTPTMTPVVAASTSTVAMSPKDNVTAPRESDSYASRLSPVPSYANSPAPRPAQSVASTAQTQPSNASAATDAMAAPVAAIGAGATGPVSATEQAKTLLALIGAIAVLYHVIRWLGAAIG